MLLITRSLSLRPHTTIPQWGLLAIGTLAASYTLLAAQPAQAQAAEVPRPQSLKGASRPEPSNLNEFVKNKASAIALGKALFWDVQVGSDGKTACASCHFHAGADSRSKNQVSPGLNRMASLTSPNPDHTFQLGGPNYQFKLSDFPFHKLANVNDRNSAVLSSINDVASSQGVFNEAFSGVTATPKSDGYLQKSTRGAYPDDVFTHWYGSTTEQRTLAADPVFHVGTSNTRRVEPRNTPTVINAVFNLRNFWDGRAEYIFNGVNPFGLRDPNAFLFKNVTSGTQWSMQPTKVRIDNASLASQASGPPGSDFEMSAAGRTFPDLGRKMLYLRPLQGQQVATTDSVLGIRRHKSGLGLNELNYAEMVKDAFRPEWWNGDKLIQISANGTKTLVPMTASPAPNQYTQMQHNFSLFFGLAVQLYQATLVSDDAPFDDYMGGDTKALSSAAQHGMGLFFGKGKCASCHGGPEFTNASVRTALSQPLNRMLMGDGKQAVYDEGFYNIGVTPTLEDLGAGGKDPFGNPLSLSALGHLGGSNKIKNLTGISPNVSISPSDRVAYNGAFKTPTLRNAELTAPYFHNGSAATLHQVIEFYNRGGNFFRNNIADVDADIEPLGLTEEEKTALVEFVKSLTDDRVRTHAAPFDHPQLMVPVGHLGNTASVTDDRTGRASDMMAMLPAVGRSGYDTDTIPANFLGTHVSGQPVVKLVSVHNNCLDVSSTALRSPVSSQPCRASSYQLFQVEPQAKGSVRIIPVHNAKYSLELASASDKDDISIIQGTDQNLTHEHWFIEDLGEGWQRLRNRRSNKCLDIAPERQTRQLSCEASKASQRFRLVSATDGSLIQ